MNLNSTSRTRDSTEVVSTLIANLAELTKKTSNFDELRNMLPLVADLKRADTNNKEMNQILRVMQQAIPKLKSTYGSTSRSSETFSNMLDRMVGQLRQQYGKLQQILKEIEGKNSSEQEKGNGALDKQTDILIQEIQNSMSNGLKKIDGQIQKQTEEIGKNIKQNSDNPYIIRLLRSKILQKQTVHQDIEQCKQVLGEIRCYAELQTVSNKSPNCKEQQQLIKNRKTVDLFISNCNLHFNRQSKIVIKKLQAFSKSGCLTKYEYKIWNQYQSMGKRLKIRLQSAIIKLVFYLNESGQIEKDKDILNKWKGVLEQWQLSLNMIKQILQ